MNVTQIITKPNEPRLPPASRGDGGASSFKSVLEVASHSASRAARSKAQHEPSAGDQPAAVRVEEAPPDAAEVGDSDTASAEEASDSKSAADNVTDESENESTEQDEREGTNPEAASPEPEAIEPMTAELPKIASLVVPDTNTPRHDGDAPDAATPAKAGVPAIAVVGTASETGTGLQAARTEESEGSPFQTPALDSAVAPATPDVSKNLETAEPAGIAAITSDVPEKSKQQTSTSERDQRQSNTAAEVSSLVLNQPDDSDVAKAPVNSSNAMNLLSATTEALPTESSGKLPGQTIAAPVPVTTALRESAFADANHAKILTAMKSDVLPNGGTMHIRLDPPELGALQVTVQMRDGMMTASFQTSNDNATQLLSHTLSQLKQGLESAGISVDRIHVQQFTQADEPKPSSDEQKQQQAFDGRSSQQEQQRKEMLRRLWLRMGGRDDLNMVA